MEKPKNQNGPMYALVGVLMPAIVFVVFRLPSLLLPHNSPYDPLNNVSLGFATFVLFPMQIVGPILFIVGCVKTWLFWNDLLPQRKLLFKGTIIAGVLLLISFVAVNVWMNKINQPTQLEVYCGQKYRYANTDEGVAAQRRCLEGNEDGTQTMPEDSNQLQVRPPNPL